MINESHPPKDQGARTVAAQACGLEVRDSNLGSDIRYSGECLGCALKRAVEFRL